MQSAKCQTQDPEPWFVFSPIPSSILGYHKSLGWFPLFLFGQPHYLTANGESRRVVRLVESNRWAAYGRSITNRITPPERRCHATGHACCLNLIKFLDFCFARACRIKNDTSKPFSAYKTPHLRDKCNACGFLTYLMGRWALFNNHVSGVTIVQLYLWFSLVPS